MLQHVKQPKTTTTRDRLFDDDDENQENVEPGTSLVEVDSWEAAIASIDSRRCGCSASTSTYLTRTTYCDIMWIWHEYGEMLQLDAVQ